MSPLLTLLKLDLYSLKGWFSHRPLSKLIVAIISLALFTSLSFVIYAVSRTFFTNFSIYEFYGDLTAQYIIHAALLLVLALGIFTSLIVNLVIQLKPNSNLNPLLHLPIKPANLVLWIQIKTFISQFFWLSLIAAPLLLSYFFVFQAVNPISIALRIAIILFNLTLLTQAAGTLLSLFFIWLYRQVSLAAAVSLAIITSQPLASYLYHLIVPPQLKLLIPASLDQFFALYNSLPLLSPNLPSSWQLHTLVNGITDSTLYQTTFSILFISASAIISSQLFGSFQQMRLQSSTNKSKSGNSNFSILPLLHNHYLRLFRTPADLYYSASLFLMAVVFFVLLNFNQRFQADQGHSLAIFSLVWLLFFSATFFMRLSFPLLTLEGKTTWWLFTLPLKRSKIIFHQLLFSLTTSLPFILLAASLYFFLSLTAAEFALFYFLSVASIIALAIFIALTGNFNPDFSLADEADKSSTSPTGLLTIIFSFFFISLVSISLYQIWQGSWSLAPALTSLTLFIILAITITFLAAKKSLSSQQF